MHWPVQFLSVTGTHNHFEWHNAMVERTYLPVYLLFLCVYFGMHGDSFHLSAFRYWINKLNSKSKWHRWTNDGIWYRSPSSPTVSKYPLRWSQRRMRWMSRSIRIETNNRRLLRDHNVRRDSCYYNKPWNKKRRGLIHSWEVGYIYRENWST